MILVIDNYDSFVYNLARYVNELGFSTLVKRSDQITLDEIQCLQPSHIIISPGPCTPNEAGISLELIVRFAATIPILGVCLGHQAIAQAFGGKIVRAKHPMHGKASLITHHQQGVFFTLENPLQVGRYHSLIVDEETLPSELEITARCNNGEIMALQHRQFPMVGVQFHPESVLTVSGQELLRNFFINTSYPPPLPPPTAWRKGGTMIEISDNFQPSSPLPPRCWWRKGLGVGGINNKNPRYF